MVPTPNVRWCMVRDALAHAVWLRGKTNHETSLSFVFCISGTGDNMELVNLNTDPSYGAMWKSRPPNCLSDHTPGTPTPPPPAQQTHTHVTDLDHQAVGVGGMGGPIALPPHTCVAAAAAAAAAAPDSPRAAAAVAVDHSECQNLITPVHRPNCEVFNTKISTLVSFRPLVSSGCGKARGYETPAFIPRSDIPDIQEMAMHAH